MYIFDNNAFEALCQVEGESWRKQQTASISGAEAKAPSPFGFFAWKAAWDEKSRLLEQHPEYEDEPVGSFLVTSGDGAIYGDGGWDRYAVRADGEIVLLKWSATAAKQEKATSLGIRVG